MVRPFILHCFPFSLTGKCKGEKSVNSTAYTYYITIMAKCTCAWLLYLLKLLTRLKHNVLLCTDSSQLGWFHVETYMHVLRLWFASTAAVLKSLSSTYDDRFVLVPVTLAIAIFIYNTWFNKSVLLSYCSQAYNCISILMQKM